MGSMTKKKRPVGRPKKPDSEKRKARAVCWLSDKDKTALQDTSSEIGRSESDLIRDGLIAIEVLFDR